MRSFLLLERVGKRFYISIEDALAGQVTKSSHISNNKTLAADFRLETDASELQRRYEEVNIDKYCI